MPVTLDLIFVHVPKTGGISVRQAAMRKYGPSLHLDYADRITNPEALFNTDRSAYLQQDHLSSLQGKKAVYGHFWIGKYHNVRAMCRATILRDPVERLVSNYFYWKSDTNTPQMLKANALRRKLVVENLTIPEFASLPNIRNFYHGCYFDGVDMGQFDAIKDYSTLRDNPEEIGRATGLDGEFSRVNRTDLQLPDYHSLKDAFYADAAALSAVRASLQEDIRFYEKWVHL
ncbi:hypothetical protein EI983_12455 [Roseovarius faecimaris]|uniref:Sulfotransferase family protein n=1 Tax=Roseovarius faecimaris TaxID=2494550 RepID=A0A6I6IUJ5_9RHOB|nr:sulfotransferase family 2 domain-containing protein [Roseovarius faecimaris]QGX99036.1 hypothetical protein EI983_12455 [Roseovarius faecimaris]